MPGPPKSAPSPVGSAANRLVKEAKKKAEEGEFEEVKLGLGTLA